MNTSMYGLVYDFVQENGHSLVFTEKEIRPLEGADLAALPVKMLESNEIPFTLAIKKEEIDFQIRLHFDITSMRMLSYFLKEHPLAMHEYYTLFLSLIAALEESRQYMLNKEHYLLKEDFIFIGRTVQDVRLLNLPIKKMTGKPPIYEDFKELLVNVAGEVEDLDGEAFKKILSYVKDPAFSLSDLKELLRGLQSKKHASVVKAQEENLYEPPRDSLNKMQEFAAFEQFQPESREIPASHPETFEAIESNLSTSKPKLSLPPLSSREKIYLFAFALIMLAVIWKLYGLHPGSFMIDVCAVLSLLVFVCVVVYSKYWRPGIQKAPVSAAATDVSIPESPTVQSEFASPTQPQWDSYPNQAAEHQNSEDYYESLSENTTLLNDSDDTVMLHDGAMPGQPSDVPYLVKEHGEKIPLFEMPFTVGRNPSSAQYVEDSIGVSRSHLEFSSVQGHYGVKDLGAKNGSRLNQQSMVPYKFYPLADGDELEIGKVTFTFRMGSTCGTRTAGS